MNTTSTPTVKFAGDEHPETLRKEQIVLVRDALRPDLKRNIFPMTAQQAEKALKLIPEGEIAYGTELDGPATAAVVAALICIEQDLHDLHQEGTEQQQKVQRAIRATGRRLVERGGNRGWLPMDLFVVALDETEHWTLKDKHKPSIERIETLYVFDRNKHAHLCEITPSHELWRVETRAIIKSGSPADDDDALREEIYRYIDDGSLDDQPVIYVHVSDMDRHLEKNAPFTVYHWGNPTLDFDEQAEMAEEEAKRAIRNTRESTNYHRKLKGEDLLPVDAATINKMAGEQFADEAQKWEATERLIVEAVCQSIRENSVL